MCDSLTSLGLHLWEDRRVIWDSASCCGPHRTLAGAEQASALEGNPQEHQRLIASRAGCQALPAFAIITRLLFENTALLTFSCTTVPAQHGCIHSVLYKHVKEHLPLLVCQDPEMSHLLCRRESLPGPPAPAASPPRRMPRILAICLALQELPGIPLLVTACSEPPRASASPEGGLARTPMGSITV